MSSYPPPPDPYTTGGTPPASPSTPGLSDPAPSVDPTVPVPPAPDNPYASAAAAPPNPYAGGTPGSPYYAAPVGTDGVSIAALVTGILGTGPVALVLGILGVRRTSRNGTGGKGMAIAGIVLGAIGTITWGIILLVAVLLASNSEVRDAFEEGWEQGWQEELGLEVGQCLTMPGDPVDIGAAEPVDCAEEHTAEVIATTLLTDDAFPGEDAVFAAADEFCLPEFGPYIGADFETSSLDLYYGGPTSMTWALGDRQVVCYVTPIDGSPLTASVAGSGM